MEVHGRHACRDWGQTAGFALVGGGMSSLVTGSYEPIAGVIVGAFCGGMLVGSVVIGFSVQAWLPRGRLSAPLPLPLRLRAAAVMAVCVLVMMGQVLPSAIGLLTDTWTFAPIGLDAFQRTGAENLLLTATFIAQAECRLALIVLPALSLPFVMCSVALRAPLVAHGIEHRSEVA